MTADIHTPVNPFQRGKTLLSSHPRQTPPVKADIVLAIDACASMAPFWGRLKQDAQALPAIVRSAAAGIGLTPGDVRLRIIAFRDLYIQPVAFECSPFCTLGGAGMPAADAGEQPAPEGLQALCDFIASVEPGGRGGPCTSGLEVLVAALHSPWRREGSMRDRILIISDSAAYNLDEPLRQFDPAYESILRSVLPPESTDLPETLDGLRRLWRDGVGEIDNWNSRVLLFTPSLWPWTQLATWSRITAMHLPPDKIRQLQLSSVLTAAFATM